MKAVRPADGQCLKDRLLLRGGSAAFLCGSYTRRGADWGISSVQDERMALPKAESACQIIWAGRSIACGRANRTSDKTRLRVGANYEGKNLGVNIPGCPDRMHNYPSG